MCCLKFEQSGYESMHKIMPRVGKEVITPDGNGIVAENNVISETTVVKVQLDDGTFEMRNYPFRELMNKSGKHYGEECTGCENGCPAVAEEPCENSSLIEIEGSDTFDQGDGSDGDAL